MPHTQFPDRDGTHDRDGDGDRGHLNYGTQL